MEQFATEEQQVEAIKKFWKENGIAIIVGAALGLGGLWGWRYWNDTQIQNQEAASIEYQNTVQALEEENGFSNAVAMVEANPDSGYALMASLILAQQAVEHKDLNEAVRHLSFVAERAGDSAISAMANLRLARVQLALEDFDAAHATLDKVTDDAFVARVDEVKGDIFVSQQQFDKARMAYAASLENDESNNIVRMKLDNLALVSGS